jgi:hypothetical protein
MKGIRHIGGEKAGKGTYWNYETGDKIRLDVEAVLDGDETVTYYSIPPAMVLMAGPFIGLVYAVMLPFIGIAALLQQIITKGVAEGVHLAGSVATFTWSPIRAYLTGRKLKKKKHGNKNRSE